jgi:dihydrodipicolinate synthase/N-acetylneuraminate lyase
MLTDQQRARLLDGLVIPAHPLALTAERGLDEPRQRALTRFYLDAGAGGIAVGVHTTQFAIRDPGHGPLYERVLRLAAEEAAGWTAAHEPHPPATPILIAGVLGPTARAVEEATAARALGYHLALVAMNGWGDAAEAEILAGIREVAQVLPLFGFYLQPAIGGRAFGYEFWRAYAALPELVAIKIAPFDRYATLAVVRAAVDAGRAGRPDEPGQIALYTGNDDTIVYDLLTPFHFDGVTAHIVGGLLGQWAVLTPAAVALHAEARRLVRAGGPVPLDLLARAAALTDVNGAIFDAANGFAGSIAGVNEVLARAGLTAGNWCLEPHERLSPGQDAEITRVLLAHPSVTALPTGSGAFTRGSIQP